MQPRQPHQQPYQPPAPPPSYGQVYQPTPPPRRRAPIWPWLLVAVGMIACTIGAVALTGGSDESPAAEGAAGTASQPAASDCAPVEAAYKAWTASRPPDTSAKALRLTKRTVEPAKTAGKTLFDAVSAQPSTPAKAFAVHVAGYNVAITGVGVTLAASGEVRPEDAAAVAAGARGIRTAYDAFAAQCG